MSDTPEIRPSVPVVPGNPQVCKWDQSPLQVIGPAGNPTLICCLCDFAGGPHGPGTRTMRPQP